MEAVLLFQALAKHPKIFDKLYVNMVKAGEIGGVLEIALTGWRSSEKAESLGQSESGHVFPVAVLFVATIIMGILMTFVIPKFKTIFADMLGPGGLPIYLIVLKISDTIKKMQSP